MTFKNRKSFLLIRGVAVIGTFVPLKTIKPHFEFPNYKNYWN